MNPTSRRLASSVVSLALGCGAHISVLNFFKSGFTFNPHNKRHSFGLFVSLYLCCFVDCINQNFVHVATNATITLSDFKKICMGSNFICPFRLCNI